ncbi:TadE/TadG family type IV pilus assembly protein [Novosphingobium sp.]|uniref:TadE/TadG family type IV pilus assembly protein n=1 Tax=Novosphingobium sp. TaxID=1874826 RepID=UPI001EB6DBDA|nr:TadE/TadG family type IV pilus assembly protein [Novosphingobium sp.]MBK6801130.1 pilus assembly protein [Novosphingobium sp.]MBK9011691.1 pilus assembly protein [Novosphingobium sp.]
MIRPRALLTRLRDDQAGTMLIETAMVTPVLVLMALGAFQVSVMIARQTELQSAAAEGAAIALASLPDTAAKRTTLAQVIRTSTGLASDKVTVDLVFRCGNETTIRTNNDNPCGSQATTSYARIRLTDTYTPAWTRFGVGYPLTFRVNRLVLLEQD